MTLQTPLRRYRKLHTKRRGYLYIAVVFSTLIIGAIAMTGLSLQADNLAAHREGGQWAQARFLADSGVQWGLAKIKANSSWRTAHSHGVSVSPVTVGSGTVAYALYDDSDNNLSDNSLENVKLCGFGTVGNARYVRSVELEPSGTGIPCLNYTLCVNGAFSPPVQVDWSTDGQFAFNGLFNTLTSSSTLTADYFYRFFRFTYRTCGTSTSMSSSIAMPPSTWSDYYNREGTTISITSLPSSDGFRNLEKVALGPGYNPYGTANSLGIYIIDCGNASLRIRNCRIRGTLLIKNPGTNSGVYDQVDWIPGTGNLPALLVDGTFALKHVEGSLSEAIQNVNFNPSGMTNSDNDKLDSYPSAIQGLTYITDTAFVGTSGSRTILHGTLVCGAISPGGDAQFVRIPDLMTNAPPGFRDGSTMRIVRDSWRRQSL